MNMLTKPKPFSGTVPWSETVADRRPNWRRKSSGARARRSVPGVQGCVSTTTVADRRTGKVVRLRLRLRRDTVGKPSWGKPDVPPSLRATADMPV